MKFAATVVQGFKLDGYDQWIVAHPVIPGQVTFDTHAPEDISAEDAHAAHLGWLKIGSELWEDIEAALMETFGITKRHAETITDAWDLRVEGSEPCCEVLSIEYA